MNRKVVLHYHLFKNAGTSVDRTLQKNFGDRWLTKEFPNQGGNNSPLVAEWIASTPEGVAYSSHTMLGPIPEVERVDIIPVILLRDPIDRIKSAYKFEQKQDADTWGAQLAKEHDFGGYVRARLDRKGDRQCRDFQTERIASLKPGDGSEIDRAVAALEAIHSAGTVGLVERFDSFMVRLTDRLQPFYEDFQGEAVRANVSSKSASAPLDPSLSALLLDANKQDFKLMKRARELIRLETVASGE
ncbi:hypothetical protein WNY37_18255 [Henriciella sp. AS95]|uniref:hypothetical protein n=1 Tax=Henriciella sp. AS95 TaxID=3135782 RepID=UPI003181E09D